MKEEVLKESPSTSHIVLSHFSILSHHSCNKAMLNTHAML